MISKIEVGLVVNPDGSMQDPGPIPVPFQNAPVEIIWTISGATFGDPGIVLGPFAPPPSFVLPNGAPRADGSNYKLTILNNGETDGQQSTVGKFKYTINYQMGEQSFVREIKHRADDPTIDNQPPTG